MDTPQKVRANPWLIILLSAPIPLALFGFVVFRWYRQSADYRKITDHFMERQNTVLAYDAMGVSTGISDLLEKTARDVEILALFPVTAENYRKFHQAQMSDFTKFLGKGEAPIQVPLTFYNRILFMNLKGDFVVHVRNGQVVSSPRNLKECLQKDLCDRELLEAVLFAPEGELRYGRLMRYYSARRSPEDERGASIHVAYRQKQGVYVLGLEYIHIRDHLVTPTFPYETKRDLFQAYQNGNYIYIVDSEYNIIAHPKYWNTIGIDRTTGGFVSPMRTDSDEGSRPINISKYTGGTLTDYFSRLLSRSFTQRGVDIFQAANLAGTTRVLSVAPIFLSRGQYEKVGVFGHVVIGCNVEHFEEPRDKLMPYY